MILSVITRETKHHIAVLVSKMCIFRTVSTVCVSMPGVGSSALGASQSTEQGHVECVPMVRSLLRNYVDRFHHNLSTFLEEKTVGSLKKNLNK